MAFIIHFSGPITPASVEVLRNNILNLVISNKADSIKINLSSSGGSLNAAFTAYEFLRSLQVPLTIQNVGSVESAAIIVYLAANERLTTEHSTFLIHNFTWTFDHPCVIYSKIKESLSALESDNARYANIVNDRTSGSDEPLDIQKCLQGEALSLSAASAVATGLATQIVSTEGTLSPTDVHVWTQICV